MFGWFKPKAQFVPDAPGDDEKLDPVSRVAELDQLSTHRELPQFDLATKLKALGNLRPSVAPGVMVSAMDSADGNFTNKAFLTAGNNIPDALAAWYGTQSFIGHQLAGIVAQHWLVLKACSTPARDATRNGFDVTTVDGDDLPPDLAKGIKRADVQYSLNRNLQEFITKGRIFGVRICIFKVDYGGGKLDDEAYEKPFNIDGVRPGSYRGMVQVDPYWCSPELDGIAAAKPDSMHFYEPTWWQINGRRYHRTHLAIFRNGEVADILKPNYQYGGIPVPQLIMERVYGAERTANEAPLLTLTKRSVIMKTDIAKAVANAGKFQQQMEFTARWQNNYGTRIVGESDEISQMETALADLDSVIMTQYQLVAACANVPVTKLLGTTPKGFNATGQYDESNYHEELESMQAHDLTPMVDRHHMLVIASKFTAHKDMVTAIKWHPLDTPTAKELAEVNKFNADADAQLVAAGGIDGADVRRRVANDKHSGYSGIVAPIDDGASIDPNAPSAGNPESPEAMVTQAGATANGAARTS